MNGTAYKQLFKTTAVAASVFGAALALGGAQKSSPATTEGAGPAVARRLSAEQYKQIITDIFGPTVKPGGRFDPELRQDGLLAIGSSYLSVTAAGMEQFDAMARSVASQVVDEAHRDELLPCKPKSETASDTACARQFLTEVGTLLYRRPLTQPEVESAVGLANEASQKLKGFYDGLWISLATMLESPQFLFRREVLEPDPKHPGTFRLNGYSKASQLSFFLWNSGPDPELLAAAAKGDLNSQSGIEHQVERMMASPRLENGVRAFFTDMLGFDEFATLAKDNVVFPQFNAAVAADAQEQTLRTLVDLVVRQRGDYRDVFTTPKTFLTQSLASVYRVPLVNDGPNGGPDRWKPYQFAANDPRGIGILSQVSFVALHSPPGRSSPTLRGKALREILLCQKVPAPPGNVKFDLVQDTHNPEYRTTRARLDAHRTNPVCAGCHKLIDPMGLSLENFDGDGGYRTSENGVQIDASGSLDGISFSDAAGLGKAMHDNPATTACVLSRMVSYGLGRKPADGEASWVDSLSKSFAASGYRIPDLMRQIAVSPNFFVASPPAEQKAASAESSMTSTVK
jgi:hypothetical protein